MNDVSIPGYLSSAWRFLRHHAVELGFCAVGVSPAGPVPQFARDHYKYWLDQGMNGDMDYTEKWMLQRFDPRNSNMLENAAVIVSVAMPYGNGVLKNGIWELVAAHARGRDYHKTVRKKLEKLGGHIGERFEDVKMRYCVDSAPVMERSWALMSRIGFIGKNGAVIVPGIGPKVVLGEIICAGRVPIPSVNEMPLESQCGKCNRCRLACPTGALDHRGLVRADRCLSYHSIERRATPLPTDVASKMIQIFGCDLCTAVCPHNGMQVHSQLEYPSNGRAPDMTVSELANGDDDQVHHILAGTCLHRTGILALRRNLDIVMINKAKV